MYSSTSAFDGRSAVLIIAAMRSSDIRLEDDWQQELDCCFYLDDQVHVVSFIGEEECRRQEILEVTNYIDLFEEHPQDEITADVLDQMESVPQHLYTPPRWKFDYNAESISQTLSWHGPPSSLSSSSG